MDDLPLGADAESYDGQTIPYKKANSPFRSPREKTVKVKKTQRASSDVLEELPLFTKSKRTAAKKATKQIVKQKVEDEKIDQGEDEFIVGSDSTSSNQHVVVKFKSGNKKRSSSSDSSDTSTSSSSDSSDSDSSSEERKNKRKRKRSKDKRRRKRDKERMSSKKRDTVASPSNPGSDYKDTHMAKMEKKSPEDKDISPKKDTVFSRTCCNKDCKITEKYTRVDYGCNTCNGRCHWDCLNDAHTCISCSTAADPTGTESAGPAVALVEPPSVKPVTKSAGGENKALKPLVNQREQIVDLYSATPEQLQMALDKILGNKGEKTFIADDDKDDKEITDTVMDDPTLAGKTEQ
jgi:hypothetical protein